MEYRVRLQLRNWNGSNVTELVEPLKALPICRQAGAVMSPLATPSQAPVNGKQIRDMNRKLTWCEMIWIPADGTADSTLDSLLDVYDLQFFPTMFLYEKKATYLRFIGASRSLMHRVLD
jgi:hypothetical protein